MALCICLSCTKAKTTRKGVVLTLYLGGRGCVSSFGREVGLLHLASYLKDYLETDLISSLAQRMSTCNCRFSGISVICALFSIRFQLLSPSVLWLLPFFHCYNHGQCRERGVYVCVYVKVVSKDTLGTI